MRRKRTDHNQAEIVRALEKLGCSVVDLSQVGGGCPDLLVGWKGRNLLVEIKNPKGGGFRWTDSQLRFSKAWNGEPAYQIDTVMAFLKQIGATKDQ